MVIPPGADTITSEFAGVLAGAEMEITEVALQIINPMRNNDPVRLTVEIVVIDQYLRQLCRRNWFQNGVHHAQTGNVLKNLVQ